MKDTLTCSRKDSDVSPLSEAPSLSESPYGKIKVRKRRSKGSFILIIALFLVVTAFRSTQGEGQHKNKSSVTEHVSPHKAEGVKNHQGTRVTTEESVTSTAKRAHEVSPTHHSTHHSSSSTTKRSSTEKVEKHISTTESSVTQKPNQTEREDDNATSVWGSRCIKPAIEQFPPTIMSPGLRKNGGFILHIAVAAYTFLALAIICDEFFVPSLEKMCEVLKIQPDVAGATFMAAGSSAPELATALIGVFVAKDDIGVSGVIGSAVFNIMFVISICGLLTQTVLYLNWWPMVRDCFFYMVSILALLGCIYDEEIEWYESIILILLYCVYCYAMYMNTVLEAWAHTLPIPFPVHDPTILPTEKSGLVTYKAVPGDQGGNNMGDGVMAGAGYGESQQSSMDYSADPMGMRDMDGSGMDPPKKVPMPPSSILTQFNAPGPEDSVFKKIMWRISLPLIYMFYYTVPDCRIEQWRAWYVMTFTMAMVWIALFSYVMVWMITVVGFTLGVPDTVMGLTFVAAGVSVPDALSSLAVMKEGFGDMAVSNAVGSNVFDILICLGLPWFLSTVVINPGESVKVISKGLTYSTLSLLSTVAFLLLATHYNGWQLNKKYGVVLMLWYLLFMILASLYELNVFGEFNPPECSSKY